jgi:hypothetical protein
MRLRLRHPRAVRAAWSACLDVTAVVCTTAELTVVVAVLVAPGIAV